MSRLVEIRDGFRRRRLERAARAHSLRTSGAPARSVPGSEHAHLLRTPGL